MHYILKTCLAMAILPAACIIGGPLHAAPPGDAGQAVANLLACRAVADAQQRLACFDREIGGLAAAPQAAAPVNARPRSQLDLATEDDVRGKVRQEQRKKAPDGTVLPKRFEAKVVSAVPTTQDRWRFTLADGTVWETIEPSSSVSPRAEGTVMLERAAFGSYFAQFDGGRTLRSRRVK